MKLVKRITKNEFYREYYTALNGILKLSKLELSILSTLSTLKNKNTNTTEYIRRDIARELDISIPTLNNYLKLLRDKKILVSMDNILDINPSIYIELDKDNYKIEFEFYVQ